MSEVIRYLYDLINGGPPRAYECLLDRRKEIRYMVEIKPTCGKITRTLEGMRTHQRLCHGFKPQAKLFKEAV